MKPAFFTWFATDTSMVASSVVDSPQDGEWSFKERAQQAYMMELLILYNGSSLADEGKYQKWMLKVRER